MSMTVINPTDSAITVVIEGREYTVLARGRLEGVPQKHAEYWKNRLHGFLTIKEDIQPGKNDTKESSVPSEWQEEEKSEDVVDETMTRDDLDAIAIQKGLDPKHYHNKSEIVKAINAQE